MHCINAAEPGKYAFYIERHNTPILLYAMGNSEGTVAAAFCGYLLWKEEKTAFFRDVSGGNTDSENIIEPLRKACLHLLCGSANIYNRRVCFKSASMAFSTKNFSAALLFSSLNKCDRRIN